MDKKTVKIIDYREIPVKERTEAPPSQKFSIIGFLQQLDKKTKIELLIFAILILSAAGFFSVSLFKEKSKPSQAPLIIPPPGEERFSP